MPDRYKIRKALISVSDKSGIIELAQTLQESGCEIISTGGTRKVLEQAGIAVTDISEMTGNPEAFGGRMKTISFQIEAALLFDREKDQEEAKQLKVDPIDMVVCNLYPFEEVLLQNSDLSTLVENIDIGGPTMIRAGAKNFEYVAVVTDLQDYQWVSEEMRANNGTLSLEIREGLMRKAFNHTADYDALIATAMDRIAGERSARFAFMGIRKLRYGENAHQNAVFMKRRGSSSSLYDMNVLHGKELSYNNIVDMQSALEAVKDFKHPGCAIIKHTNPCGLAVGDNQRELFEVAWAGDPVSAFGSVIAFNRTVEFKTVRFLNLDNEDRKQRKFVEIVVAPGFTKEALEYLFLHKNLRVIEFDPASMCSEPTSKFLHGALLSQDADAELTSRLETVTRAVWSVDHELVEFGVIAVRQLKSNAIVVVRRTESGLLQLLGMGCGQPNRVIATKLALEKCVENLKSYSAGQTKNTKEAVGKAMEDVILVSDAFFPFPDSIDLCAEFSVKTIVQPGGSMRDKAVIRRCDELGLAMILTGTRHFRH